MGAGGGEEDQDQEEEEDALQAKKKSSFLGLFHFGGMGGGEYIRELFSRRPLVPWQPKRWKGEEIP